MSEKDNLYQTMKNAVDGVMNISKFIKGQLTGKNLNQPVEELKQPEPISQKTISKKELQNLTKLLLSTRTELNMKLNTLQKTLNESQLKSLEKVNEIELSALTREQFELEKKKLEEKEMLLKAREELEVEELNMDEGEVKL